MAFSHMCYFKAFFFHQHCEFNKHVLINELKLIFLPLQILTIHPDFYSSFLGFKTS